MRKGLEKTCQNPQCAKPFTAKDYRQKYCGLPCAGAVNSKGRVSSTETREKQRLARVAFYKAHPNPQKGSSVHAQAVGKGTRGKHRPQQPATLMELSSRTVRKILQRLNPGCSRCGWREGIGDLHHINGRKVPDPNGHWNLTYLCPNCHRVAHVKKLSNGELVSVATQLGSTWVEVYYG